MVTVSSSCWPCYTPSLPAWLIIATAYCMVSPQFIYGYCKMHSIQWHVLCCANTGFIKYHLWHSQTPSLHRVICFHQRKATSSCHTVGQSHVDKQILSVWSGCLKLASTERSRPVTITDSFLRATENCYLLVSTMIHPLHVCDSVCYIYLHTVSPEKHPRRF